jgi:hypothetical protein
VVAWMGFTERRRKLGKILPRVSPPKARHLPYVTLEV